MGGNPTVSDISHLSIRDYHTILALVNRMEKRGLLKREKRSGKGNPGSVTITEKGHQALIESLKREAIYASMSALTDEEREQFAVFLKKVRDAAVLYSALQDTPEI